MVVAAPRAEEKEKALRGRARVKVRAKVKVAAKAPTTLRTLILVRRRDGRRRMADGAVFIASATTTLIATNAFIVSGP